ncbi:hypothetical protein GGR50DRAFT_282788 [Xylaria sp. CBS 124048]|nr:hypothetical protein GGR50DRAFT_282788 [Xylaria sp. CBS 124048]
MDDWLHVTTAAAQGPDPGPAGIPQPSSQEASQETDSQETGSQESGTQEIDTQETSLEVGVKHQQAVNGPQQGVNGPQYAHAVNPQHARVVNHPQVAYPHPLVYQHAPFHPPAFVPQQASSTMTTTSYGPFAAPFAGPSFAQRTAQTGDHLMRELNRLPPGDTVGRRKTQREMELNRRRSAYFKAQLVDNDRSEDPSATLIRKEAMVVVELKTNVIVLDEVSIVEYLAQHIAEQYQRPRASVCIYLQHSACMMFSGTVDPACILTVYALPSLVQPTMNRRAALLLQQYLDAEIGIAPERCYIRFEATPETNFGTGGTTVAARLEEAERNNPLTDSPAAKPSKSRGLGIMKSVRSLGSFRAHSGSNNAENAPMRRSANNEKQTSRVATIPELPPTPPDDQRSGEEDGQGEENEAPKRQSRRQSLRYALFGRE